MSRPVSSFVAKLGRRIQGEWALRALPPADRALVRRVRAARLTYLPERKLAALARAMRAVEAEGVAGDVLEAGCALGGSAIVLARLKRPDRALRIYDVFGTIPPPGEHDPPEVHARYRTIADGAAAGLGGDRYYGYEPDLAGRVRDNLAQHGVDAERDAVTLVEGLVQDTLVVDAPVALAHIDVDWHEPVAVCLARIAPHLAVGGRIVIDDYHDWGGCRTATDAFLAEQPGGLAADDSAGSMTLTRVRA